MNYFPSRLDPVRHSERFPENRLPLSGPRERRMLEKENNFQQVPPRCRLVLLAALEPGHMPATDQLLVLWARKVTQAAARIACCAPAARLALLLPRGHPALAGWVLSAACVPARGAPCA